MLPRRIITCILLFFRHSSKSICLMAVVVFYIVPVETSSPSTSNGR